MRVDGLVGAARLDVGRDEGPQAGLVRGEAHALEAYRLVGPERAGEGEGEPVDGHEGDFAELARAYMFPPSQSVSKGKRKKKGTDKRTSSLASRDAQLRPRAQ